MQRSYWRFNFESELCFIAMFDELCVWARKGEQLFGAKVYVRMTLLRMSGSSFPARNGKSIAMCNGKSIAMQMCSSSFPEGSYQHCSTSRLIRTRELSFRWKTSEIFVASRMLEGLRIP